MEICCSFYQLLIKTDAECPQWFKMQWHIYPTFGDTGEVKVGKESMELSRIGKDKEVVWCGFNQGWESGNW